MNRRSRLPDSRKAAGHPAMRSKYSPGNWVTHRLFPGRFELVRHQGLGEWAARHEIEAQGTARNSIQERDFAPAIATVLVDGSRITGTIYHIRENGWPCVQTDAGRVASGPEE